jgi:hypothetical protein
VDRERDEASTRYRKEEDLIGGWIEERCFVAEKHKATNTDLYTDYKSWATDSGYQPLGKKLFGRQLDTRGFVLRHTSTGSYRFGLKTKPNGAKGPKSDGFSGKSDGFEGCPRGDFPHSDAGFCPTRAKSDGFTLLLYPQENRKQKDSLYMEKVAGKNRHFWGSPPRFYASECGKRAFEGGSKTVTSGQRTVTF